MKETIDNFLEIEKMYENAGIKKQQTCSHSDTCYNGSLDECEGCNSYQYPPFTAEKQLELIKWLGKNKNGFGCFNYGTEGFSCHCDFNWEDFDKDFYAEDFDNALAGLINNLWHNLAEEECKQIKEILE